MEENELKSIFNTIFCRKCKDFKKIQINTNWKERSIDISFECGHKNDELAIYEQKDYCLSCKKYIEKYKECEDNHHYIISKNNLCFYCKTHFEKYNSYCDECDKNICDKCICTHENIKTSYVYYFSFKQIQELFNTYDEAEHYINSIFSLDCNKKIGKIFNNYYYIYEYFYNKSFFHINIIFNINLLYNFFKHLTKRKLIITGFFSILEINNIKDSTLFYDSEFKDQFSDLINMQDFNFNNVLNLFLLSKRFERKDELFSEFSYNIYSTISENNLEFDI